MKTKPTFHQVHLRAKPDQIARRRLLGNPRWRDIIEYGLRYLENKSSINERTKTNAEA